MERNKKTVFIISGGALDAPFTYHYLEKEHKSGDLVIAAEKGVIFCISHGIRPDLAIGDFDSVREEELKEIIEADTPMQRYPSEKDETDTELALREALKYKTDRIVLFGATGTRLDHVMANIAILERIALESESTPVEVKIVDSHNCISVHTKPFRLTREECEDYHYISFFAASEQVRGLTLEGFRYPVQDFTLRHTDSIGTSNELIEKTASVNFLDGVLLCILSRD